MSQSGNLSDRQRIELFEVTAGLTGVGHWHLNTRTNEVWWSDEVYRIHAMEKSEHQPNLEEAIESYHPEDRDIVSNAITESIKSGQPFEFDLRLQRADGSIRYVKSIGLCEFDTDQTVIGLFGVFQDETEQRLRNMELFEDRMRLEVAAKAGRFGIWDLDLKEGTVHWDERMRDIYGMTARDKVQQTDFVKTVHPDDLERINSEITAALKGTKPFDTQFRIVRPDGSIRQIKANGTVIYDPATGLGQRMIGVNYDVTSWHELQREAVLAKEEQQLANRMKSEFLANMSHEIRTPINAIMGFSEIISLNTFKYQLDEKYRQYATHVHDAAQHLLEIINDVLDISRLESGRMDVNPNVVDVHKLLSKLETMNHTHLASKNQSFDLLADKTLRVHMDPKHFRQIIQNFLTNAIKYSPDGSHISCTARLHTERHAIIEVIDSGIGIAEKDQELIWKPFHQVREAAYLSSEGGTGLGLPLSHKLAELNNCTVGLESVLGAGTKTWLIAPLCP